MTTGEKEDVQQAEVLFLGIDLSTQQVYKNRWKERVVRSENTLRLVDDRGDISLLPKDG